MPKLELQSTGRNQIRKASRQAIADYFVSLPRHERRQKWIRKTNPYRHDCVKRYSQDYHRNSIDDRSLVEYIAASGPTHVIDGWSFVGRSVQALLRRDSYAAIHFGYYAELRAAMALLASEGIGILDNKHPVAIANNKTIRLSKFLKKDGVRNSSQWARTHTVIVPCLRYWSTLQKAANLLDSIVQPSGIALSTWLSACGAHARVRAVAKIWLKAWGLDLAQINTDHDARNLVSYRPSEFRRPIVTEIDQLATFLRELWGLFEPSPNFRFNNLEVHLLRLALCECGIAQPRVQDIEDLGFTNAEARMWLASITQVEFPIPLTEAKSDDNIESERCPMQVISRAVLLLYIATRASGLHLASAGYDRDELEFWWKRFGIDRGLWDASNTPTDPRDAWADVQDSLSHIEEYFADNSSDGLYQWRREMGLPLDDFGSWELVAVWGLVP